MTMMMRHGHMLYTSSNVAGSTARMIFRYSSNNSNDGGSLKSVPARVGFSDVNTGIRNNLLLCRRRGLRAAQTVGAESSSTISGVVFQPFIELLKKPEYQVSDSSQSLARQRYHTAAEAAVNDQINVEYNVSYIYHGLFAYFDRDNVGLPGFAKYFKELSEEERDNAERLMKYQNLRGGKVLLHSILTPGILECDDLEKGDALYAMELSLSLDKLVNEKLLAFHKVAQEVEDPQLQEFIESHFLEKQVERIKKVAQYVSQLRRVGKGHGLYHFDLVLRGEEEADEGVDGL